MQLLALCFATGALSAMLFSPSAHAKCAAGSETLFSCTTAKGKQIDLVGTVKQDGEQPGGCGFGAYTIV